MIAEISTAVASVKTAANITKYLISLDKDTAVNEKAIELQQTIMSLQQNIFDVQSKYQDLIDEKNQIKKELMDLKNWDAEKKKYSLYLLSEDVYVYVKNDSNDEIEKSVKFCSKCFNDGRLSIIQYDSEDYVKKIYICHTCKSQYKAKIEDGNGSKSFKPKRF